MADKVNIYDKGDMVRIASNFKDIAGADVDPTTIIFRIKQPDGTVEALTYETDPEVVRDSTGKYHYDLSLDQAGEYQYRVEGLGDVQAASQAKLRARSSNI